MTMTYFRTEKLKKNLMCHFGEQISFWRPKKYTRCELGYSDHTPRYCFLLKDLVSEAVPKTRHQLRVKLIRENRLSEIDHVSMHLVSFIMLFSP